MTDYVHPGPMISKNDGDRHWVTGRALIQLYGLNPRTTVIVQPNLQGEGGRHDEPGDRHFYPRYDGNYRTPEPEGTTP